MKKKGQSTPRSDQSGNGISVQEIIKRARGNLTQHEFVDLLRTKHKITTSQGLLSKYESGKVNPPAEFINKCMAIIHNGNAEVEISLKDLEFRMRKVLVGPSHASARRAFAMLLDSMAGT